jgi:hypothetical protein
MESSTIRRSLAFGIVCLLLPAGCGQDTSSPPAELVANPWTHLDFLDDPATFHFAVVGDRAGWHRPDVFQSAVQRLEALGPTFVMSVGDLVDTGDFGMNPDLFTEEALEQRWAEVSSWVGALPMPFFFVGGNNELRTDAMEEVWARQLGPTYYHFLYQDVLFIVLNSEEPPGDPMGGMGDAQLEWLREVLTENLDVRWTFLFLHKPMWELTDHPAWMAVEEALGDRPRTAFGGHAHRYSRSEVDGHVYYRLATTGGGSDLSGIAEGQFDHLAWVTMTDQGPRVSNLMLDGIWGDDPVTEVGK